MVERRQAERTSFVFGRETAEKSPLKAITDLVEIKAGPDKGKYRQYVVTAWNHDENSEKQSSASLRAGRADVFGEDGFLWGDGNIEIEIPSEEGFLDIIQGVLADPAPVSTELFSKILVDTEDYNYSDVKEADFFTDAAAVTKFIFTNKDLTETSLKDEITDDLASYDAIEMTIQLANARLSNTSRDGRVDIFYVDVNGERQRERRMFADGAQLGTAQMFTLPAGAHLVDIQPSRFNRGTVSISVTTASNLLRNPDPDAPGRLKFTIGADNSAVGGTVSVCGVRKVGLASTDTLPLQEEIPIVEETIDSVARAVALTENYFHHIEEVEILKADGTPLGDSVEVDIQSEPGGYSTTLKTVNDEFIGWSMEPEIGGEPWLVTRAVPIGAEIEVGETIGATIDMLSNRVDKRRTIGGGAKNEFTSTPRKLENDGKFAFIGRRFFSGYGRYLVIDGDAVICDAAPVSISHNYDFSQGELPGRFRRGTEPTARRNVTSSVQTKYQSGTAEEDIFIKWDEKFRNNESVAVKIVTYQWLGNGRQLAIIYEMPNCEIVSPVRVPVTGPGSIPVTVELKAVPPEDEVDGELKVTIVGDDQWG